jgi:hypothetical protein
MSSAEPDDDCKLRNYSRDLVGREWENSFIGRSGIRLRLKLSAMLHPANWVSTVPEFASCLDDSPEAASLRRIGSKAFFGGPGWPPAPASPSAASKSRAAHGASTHNDDTDDAARLPPTQPSKPRPRRGVRSDVGMTRAAAAPASSFAPVSAPPTSTPNDTPGRQGKRGRGGGEASQCGGGASAAQGPSITAGGETLESLGALHRSALSMELEASGGALAASAWMTATVLDALLFSLARAYPRVCFLPCQFAAYELPHAARRRVEGLRDLRPVDVLGREVAIAADALWPVDHVAGYEPMPTHAPRGEGAPLPWAGKLVASHPAGRAFVPPSYASANSTLVFFAHVGAVHWTVVRVELGAHKCIEVYEPFGISDVARGAAGAARNGAGAGAVAAGAAPVSYSTTGLSLRTLPKDVLTWLDACCPLPSPGGWRARSRSAITKQQQVNGWDCGVAGLLYAEKIGQGLQAETICQTTDQEQISAHRAVIADYVKRELERQ